MTILRWSESDVSFLSGILYGVVILLAIAAFLSGQIAAGILLILFAGFLWAKNTAP